MRILASHNGGRSRVRVLSAGFLCAGVGLFYWAVIRKYTAQLRSVDGNYNGKIKASTWVKVMLLTSAVLFVGGLFGVLAIGSP
jgi:hypothetical protein